MPHADGTTLPLPPLQLASSVSRRAGVPAPQRASVAAAGAPGTFSPPTCLLSGLRTDEEGLRPFCKDERGHEM